VPNTKVSLLLLMLTWKFLFLLSSVEVNGCHSEVCNCFRNCSIVLMVKAKNIITSVSHPPDIGSMRPVSILVKRPNLLLARKQTKWNTWTTTLPLMNNSHFFRSESWLSSSSSWWWCLMGDVSHTGHRKHHPEAKAFQIIS
jgi:hypothetical protein